MNWTTPNIDEAILIPFLEDRNQAHYRIFKLISGFYCSKKPPDIAFLSLK